MFRIWLAGGQGAGRPLSHLGRTLPTQLLRHRLHHAQVILTKEMGWLIGTSIRGCSDSSTGFHIRQTVNMIAFKNL